MIGEKINERVQAILAAGKRRQGMDEENSNAKNSASSALQEVMQNLEQVIAQQKKSGGKGPETVADDASFSPEVQAKIEQEETLIRPVLALFGVDYDSLVQEGGSSVYSRAVLANPAVLQHVAGAESPVLAALQVATTFQPYAEFMDKYGQEPEAIKEAILAEAVAGESKKTTKQKQEVPSTPFSTIYTPSGAGVVERKTSEHKSLSEILR